MVESSDSVLWTPDRERVRRAHMTLFAREFLTAHGFSPEAQYEQLHRLSLEQVEDFWLRVWRYCGIPGSPGSQILARGPRMIDARWFPDGRLSFAQAMVHPERLQDDRFAEAIAIRAFDEAGQTACLTRRQLFEAVCALVGFFRRCGIGQGDAVVGVLPNVPQAVVAMIATAAVGAVWSTCSPEFGEDAIVDRFGQIQPRLLITSQRTTYNGKAVEPLRKVEHILHRLPSIKSLIVVGGDGQSQPGVSATSWEEAMATPGDSSWQEYAFDQPLCVVYSSGTTGAPKCMVHGVGGTVLQHAKEHQLHCDLHDGDVLFYYTTTGWMMWNWLVSGLISKATIVLYDGSPFARGPETLLELASSVGVTHFGAGARYYAALEKHGVVPDSSWTSQRLRCVLSTGSPLLPSNFEWLYSALGDAFTLASISGGTDILSCFVLGNPTLPVRSGRIQCKGLGMDVQVWDGAGQRVLDQPGELVCASPFPSMPIHFWNDPEQSKYLGAYFSRFPNIWCHGDWAEENQRGEYTIYGRSDATLNPGGVRIGTAEIYQQMEAFPEVAESVATALREAGDEQIVLFVRLADGHQGGSELAERIRLRLKTRCSPRHVPKFVDFAPDLPRTVSGKLSEIAVRCAINGGSLGNAGALANPECLAFFESWSSAQAI